MTTLLVALCALAQDSKAPEMPKPEKEHAFLKAFEGERWRIPFLGDLVERV